ncbi:hypothetical protein [Pedobacter sp. NJ-S-72]
MGAQIQDAASWWFDSIPDFQGSFPDREIFWFVVWVYFNGGGDGMKYVF